MSKFVASKTPAQSIADVMSALPNPDNVLEWGVQTLSMDVVRAMILLASKESEDFRYALGVTLGMAQLLYEPVGNGLGKTDFVRCDQVDTLIGHMDVYPVHVFQQVPEYPTEYLCLLILDDSEMVTGTVLTRLRPADEHQMKLITPKDVK